MASENRALLEAMSNFDATRGPMQVTRTPCPTEDGGIVKMEVQEL